MQRITFRVVDAGRRTSRDFAQRLEGPSVVELVSAAGSTAIDASVRLNYAGFSSQLNEWSVKVKLQLQDQPGGEIVALTPANAA